MKKALNTLEVNFKTVETFSTMDYDKFKFLDFNRPIDQTHVNTLIESMKLRGFTTELNIIYTNIIDGTYNLYILEGQHRFTAAQTLKIPFRFNIVQIDTKVELAHFIADVNSSSKGWNTKQFLKVWTKMDFKEYVKLKNIFDTTDMQITPLILAYTGSCDMKPFRKGKLTFINESEGDTIIEQIMDLKDSLPSKAFCRRAIIKVMRNKKYNHENIKPYIKRHARQLGFTENETDLFKELSNLLKISNKK